MLTTSLLRSPEMLQYRDQWDQLYFRDPEGQFFQSRIFIEPITTRKPEDFIYLAVWNNDVLIGLMPLWIVLMWDDRRDCYATEILLAGSKHWADYNAPLIDPAFEVDAILAIAGALKDIKWARFRLKYLRMSEQRRRTLFDAFSGEAFGFTQVERRINSGTTNNLACPAITLPDTFDAYLAKLSRNTRQKLRRLLRRLDAGEFKIRYGQTREDLEIFMDLWEQLWVKKKERDRLTRTYGRILMEGLKGGCLSMPMLERDGHVVGVLANFVDPVKQAIMFFVSARDPDVRDTPIGLMMHAHEIRRYIEEGYTTYDMLRGDEPYKMQLGGQISNIDYTVIRRRSHVAGSLCLSEFNSGHLKTEIEFLVRGGDHEVAKTAEAQLQQISTGQEGASDVPKHSYGLGEIDKSCDVRTDLSAGR